MCIAKREFISPAGKLEREGFRLITILTGAISLCSFSLSHCRPPFRITSTRFFPSCRVQNYNLFTFCSYNFPFRFLFLFSQKTLSERRKERVRWHRGEKWIYTFSISNGVCCVRGALGGVRLARCNIQKYLRSHPSRSSRKTRNGFKWIRRKRTESSICW